MGQHLGGFFQKFSRRDSESYVFFLHYRVTFLIMMSFFILVMYNLYIKSPMVCMSMNDAPTDVIQSYCWSHSTFSVASAYNKKVGIDIPYPGVDSYKAGDAYIFHDYYQWIHIVLFWQGVFFYLPYGIWKYLDNGKVVRLLGNICDPPPVHLVLDVKEKNKELSNEYKIHAAAVYLFERFGWFNGYAHRYWFCEILSWLNIILQTWFLNSFFKGEFIHFGERTTAYFESSPMENPMLSVFPRVAKCRFHTFASSGVVMSVDVLCTLPINALTEKIYLFIWYWFVFLFVVSSLALSYTCLTLLSPRVREFWLLFSITPSLCSTFFNVEVAASEVGRRCKYGDWFVLNILGKNMDIFDYRQLLLYLNREMTLATNRRHSGQLLENENSV